jgi:SPP1 gp7 family putative phage head morphogenesis protein
MPYPLVVKMVQEFQQALLDRESAQFADMAKQWLEIERTLEGKINALALEIDSMRLQGQPPSAEQVRKVTRYRTLLAQTQVELRKYNDYADALIGKQQTELFDLGWQHAKDTIAAAQVERGKIGATFDKMNVRAVEIMAGFASDGTPLMKLLEAANADAVAGLTSALLRGVSQGWNPTKLAREMANGLGIGLNRALVLARTEQLKAYREANRQGFAQSGVVMKYKRIAAKSDRTCMACLFADGTIYDVNTAFDEHPNGRCAMIPWVSGLNEPQWETGTDWFMRQSSSTQIGIMGTEYYQAWQAGLFTLPQLVSTHDDPTWGAYLKPTPLGDLTSY